MAYVERFSKPLNRDQLENVLTGGREPAEPLPTRIPLEPLLEAVRGVLHDLTESELDQALLEPVHRSLASLTHREAADMRVWHWVCAVALPDQVWRRWWRDWEGAPPTPPDVAEALTTAMSRRFLGSSSLAGRSRNTFARLWWAAEHLREGEDYALARKALSNQDMFQNVFERFFGDHPPAARACLSRFEGRPPGEIRRAAKWLQQAASTTLLETLEEGEIGAILDEMLENTREPA